MKIRVYKALYLKDGKAEKCKVAVCGQYRTNEYFYDANGGIYIIEAEVVYVQAKTKRFGRICKSH